MNGKLAERQFGECEVWATIQGMRPLAVQLELGEFESK